METIKLTPGQLYSPLCQLRRWIGKPHPVHGFGFNNQPVRVITSDEILLFIKKKQGRHIRFNIFLDKNGKELWLDEYYNELEMLKGDK